MIQYFGERWDAPRVDNAIEVATPVGQKCLYCTEPVEDGDRGLMTPYVRDVDGEASSGIAPVHMECDLRMAIGNVAHLQGRCRCHTTEPAGEPPKSFRDEARETLAWVNAERARRGLAPM